MVVWEDGKMKKADYRKFGIKTVRGANDFGMLYEVVSRHYTRVQAQGGPWPDLIVIDGGRGQLNAAIDALRALDIAVGNGGLAAIGLAKERADKGERIFRPGDADPAALDPGAASTRLLQRIRDEAHRFAITYHRAVRHRRLAQSRLDAVVGIGPARKRLVRGSGASNDWPGHGRGGQLRPRIPDALARLLLHALRESDPGVARCLSRMVIAVLRTLPVLTYGPSTLRCSPRLASDTFLSRRRSQIVGQAAKSGGRGRPD
jgi:hypothetical protein